MKGLQYIEADYIWSLALSHLWDYQRGSPANVEADEVIDAELILVVATALTGTLPQVAAAGSYWQPALSHQHLPLVAASPIGDWNCCAKCAGSPESLCPAPPPKKKLTSHG